MSMDVLLIILFGAVAALIGLRLYMVLGQRSDDDVVQRSPSLPDADLAGDVLGGDEAEVHFTGPGAATMHEIREADGQFHPETFLAGAAQAYEMIGKAFAAGDRDGLRPLLSDEVMTQWSAAIDQRETEGHTQSFTVQSMNPPQIEDVEFDGRVAVIDVEFEADIVSVTTDKDGAVLQGDHDVARRVHEVWSFQRAVDSDRPEWVLITVQAG